MLGATLHTEPHTDLCRQGQRQREICEGKVYYLHVDLDEGAPAQGLAVGVLADGKVAISVALPQPLLVIIVLTDHLRQYRIQVSGSASALDDKSDGFHQGV